MNKTRQEILMHRVALLSPHEQTKALDLWYRLSSSTEFTKDEREYIFECVLDSYYGRIEEGWI